ncbi:hypothetical protein BTJ40_05025 [Microbulbifer sp. A4B17]|nr:hypothetical protein BTJ40_05025 [Microbulbifer sp. A4B17]
MPNFREIEREASRLRSLLNSCDKTRIKLVTPDFPVMNCKLSSMLLAYHFLKLWPKVKIIGVGGVCKDRSGNETISHYWLEVDRYCVDITSDQYNILSTKELNDDIVYRRPYKSVRVSIKQHDLLYRLFRISYREEHTEGFPLIAEDFIENMELDYEQLFNQKLHT